MPSLTVENYLKAIYLIASRRAEGEAVATGEIAQSLNVSPGTVTGMLKTLSEADLATYTPYEGARLSASGRRLALKVLRRHRLLELFLAHTRLGASIRAVGQHAVLAKTVGIRTERVILATFATGTFVSVVGSSLIALEHGLQPTFGLLMVLKIIVAVRIGSK